MAPTRHPPPAWHETKILWLPVVPSPAPNYNLSFGAINRFHLEKSSCLSMCSLDMPLVTTTAPAAANLLHRYVRKKFPGFGVHDGEVVSYDNGRYKVIFDDDDEKEYSEAEVRKMLTHDRASVPAPHVAPPSAVPASPSGPSAPDGPSATDGPSSSDDHRASSHALVRRDDEDKVGEIDLTGLDDEAATAALIAAGVTPTAAAAKVVHAKRVWTEAEDKHLIETVTKFGAQRWSSIASHMTGKVGTQCRYRWFNHLCPAVKKDEWTEEEDQLIAEGVVELGTRWVEIVKRLPGRTDSAIKNRFYNNQGRQQTMQRCVQAAERGEGQQQKEGGKRSGNGSKRKRVATADGGAEGEGAEGAEGAEREGFLQPGTQTRTRRVACRECASCLRTDCGACKPCLDKPAYGGEGRLKQVCIHRRCQEPRERESHEQSKPRAISPAISPPIWVACDRCSKWRLLLNSLTVVPGAEWFCEMNPDPKSNTCDAPEPSACHELCPEIAEDVYYVERTCMCRICRSRTCTRARTHTHTHTRACIRACASEKVHTPRRQCMHVPMPMTMTMTMTM